MRTKSKYIAQLIYNRRMELKISQQKLSKELGFSKKNSQAISNIERFKNGLPPKKIKILSEALMIDTSQVIEAMVKDYERNLIKEVLKDESPIIYSETINQL